ncbi:hypothetical protein DFJ74DRAFT_700957 [Hyaloraphidium curvatum]|nr:hypothetical protein DFJ74DRAFT_700957 [Hyaloraphidium curvatum]
MSVTLQPEPAPVKNDRYTQRPKGSTWGDFGADDQKGRLNLVTADKVREGFSEVKDFKTICLSLPLDLPGGELLSVGRGPPKLKPTYAGEHPMFCTPMTAIGFPGTDVVCDDEVTMVLQYSSQWDTLAHVGGVFDPKGDGKPVMCFYNGYQAQEHIKGPVVYSPDGKVLEKHEHHPGAHALGVQNLAEHPIQGRAVMIDLAKHFGTGRNKIGYKQLKEVIEKDKIDVKKGDFVLLHTGYGQMLMDAKGQPTKELLFGTGAVLDGRDPELLQWVTDSGVVALISDNYAVEAFPEPNPPADPSIPHAALGLHEHCLFKLGCYLGELWYLTELADYLKSVGRTAFLLTAPPLRLPGAVGSPANGIATV